MKDYAEGKKKSSIALKGVKQDDEVKPVSLNAKKMFEALAKQKMMNDMKKQRKKEQEWGREQKKIKKQQEYVKQQEAYVLETQQKLYNEQQEAFWNPKPDNNGFWG
jgi:hypothetical protein